ncbi:hypothetical protein S40288_02707 [Stachybotrys chartarum IBT 40288]|nr:hypothetical protein S40288_02707 [Stachybotrys chartarum IBT 40288]
MSHPADASLPERQQQQQPQPYHHQLNTVKDDDVDLTASLQQLSLGSSPAKPPRSSRSPAPLKPSSRQSSVSPGRRVLSRSSSNGREPHAASPTLMRKASTNSLHSANGAGAPQSSSRRSSSAQLMSPGAKPGTPTSFIAEEEKPPLTANQVAKDHFTVEMEALHGLSSRAQTDAVVILHDAVYGHRFSRPRTSRGALSTIVERPERIKAGVLGLSTAYVRLAERHCNGAVPPHPDADIQALDRVPFRIHKTARSLPLSSQAVTNVHGTKWMEELTIMCDSAESKLAMGGKELQRPDMARGPDHPTPQRLHEGDLYLCSESRSAMEGATGAVCEAVDTVLGQGPRRAFVNVRPPGHHCSASYPSGFCWVNNVHVGIMHGFMNHGLTHAAIIDFDLHHGDGSQDIAWQHNTRAINAPKNAAAWKKTSIGYFSLHDINSYPCEGGDEEKVKNASLCIDNAHGQTIWNVHLQSWKSEPEFWQLYETKYAVILEKVRSYLKAQSERVKSMNQRPKAAIFFSAGFDASEWESGGMQRHQANVPTEFYARLTQDVVKIAAEDGTGVDGRVISVLEGGYSDRALVSGVLSHLSGLVGNRQAPAPSAVAQGQQDEHEARIAEQQQSRDPTYEYDPAWWASSELDKLEQATPSPPTPPRKPRTVVPPTYSSPTQASTARCVDPAKMRRSLSGLSVPTPRMPSRSPTPPPPDVPWETAAQELCRLLIPSDRQTDSCRAEDLNAEATRARRDRQSMLAGVPVASAAPAAPPTADKPAARMSLRGRKPKASVSTEADQSQVGRRASRRLSGTPTLFTPTTESSPPLFGNSSSAPSTVQNTPVSVPSGREQNSMKPPPKPRTSTARKEAAPRAPRPRKSAPKAPAAAPAAAASGQAGPSGPEDDMDKITSGMRKIKINLITPAQKEAREKARLEVERAASSPVQEPPSQTPTEPLDIVSPTSDVLPELPSLTGPRQPSPQATPPTEAPTEQPSSGNAATPVQEHFSSSAPSPDLPPPPAPQTPRGIPSVSVQPSSDPADVFIPYQPDGPPPAAVAPPETLTWLPPNASASAATTPAATPSPAKKQDRLFHYTTGIPFAPKPAGEVKKENESGGSMWDVPETPQK